MKIENMFPFDLVPFNSNILLYGGGQCGKDFYNQIKKMQWCNIISIIDQRNENEFFFNIPIIHVDQIPSSDQYDQIVLAIADKDTKNILTTSLLKLGISKEKIVCPEERFCVKCSESMWVENNIKDKLLQIAIISRDKALGNTIMNLKQYQALNSFELPCQIDVYSGNAKVTESIFFNQDNLRCIYDIKTLYGKENKYDLIIQAGYIISIIQAVKTRLDKLAPCLIPIVTKLHEEEIKNEKMMIGKSQHAVFSKIAKVREKNCFTISDMSNELGINNKNVDVYLNEDFLNGYERLNLNKQYITFHHGADENGGGTRQTKVWPSNYHEKFNRFFKEKYPHIELIQLGGNESERVAGADRYIWGENLEIVKYILKNSLMHIDCEGGLVHLATQLGTKCTVLFGPTDIDFYGYSQNLNISPKKCGNCMGATENWRTECIISNKPECMYSITPEYVIEKIEKLEII